MHFNSLYKPKLWLMTIGAAWTLPVALQAQTDTLALRQLKEGQKVMRAAYKDSTAEVRMAAEELYLSNFITTHASSPASLDALKQFLFPIPGDVRFIKKMFSKLSADVQHSPKGKEISGQLDKLALVAVDAMAPDFEQVDTNGKLVKLSDFRGKYVLVDFWASWCKPCRKENPALVKAYAEYKNSNFTILGVSMDRSKEAWVGAIAEDGLTWLQVADIDNKSNRAADIYQIQAIPQNVLVDPSGKIIARNLRGEQVEKKLFETLGSKAKK